MTKFTSCLWVACARPRPTEGPAPGCGSARPPQGPSPRPGLASLTATAGPRAATLPSPLLHQARCWRGPEPTGKVGSKAALAEGRQGAARQGHPRLSAVPPAPHGAIAGAPQEGAATTLSPALVRTSPSSSSPGSAARASPSTFPARDGDPRAALPSHLDPTGRLVEGKQPLDFHGQPEVG